MSRVVEVSRGQLEARRDAILDRLGMSIEDLHERAGESVLVGDEWAAWQELCDIAFLLRDA